MMVTYFRFITHGSFVGVLAGNVVAVEAGRCGINRSNINSGVDRGRKGRGRGRNGGRGGRGRQGRAIQPPQDDAPDLIAESEMVGDDLT